MKSAAALLLVSGTLALAACGSEPPAAPPSPGATSSAAPQPTAKETAARQTKMEGEDFTVSCRGLYNFTNEGKTSEGTQIFKLTVSPTRGVAMMTGFLADGFYDRTQKEMNDEVRDIFEISEDAIMVSGLKLNRLTGKYTLSITTSGSCQRAALIPIPTSAKF